MIGFEQPQRRVGHRMLQEFSTVMNEDEEIYYHHHTEQAKVQVFQHGKRCVIHRDGEIQEPVG